MIEIIKYILQFISILMISVIIHELGHTISALLCGVKVNVFGIGFYKPYLHKKIFGIDFRLSPWLLGGYTDLVGESDKRVGGFLFQPYRKKAIILLSGIAMNLIIACICYLINYKSISFGIWVDLNILKGIWFRNYNFLGELFIATYPNIPNFFLLQLSILNLFCAGFNLIPFPALDGGLLWMVGLEHFFKVKRFIKILKYLSYFGIVSLLLGQFIILYFWWIK